jgi:hypothetical protein
MVAKNDWSLAGGGIRNMRAPTYMNKIVSRSCGLIGNRKLSMLSMWEEDEILLSQGSGDEECDETSSIEMMLNDQG